MFLKGGNSIGHIAIVDVNRVDLAERIECRGGLAGDARYFGIRCRIDRLGARVALSLGNKRLGVEFRGGNSLRVQFAGSDAAEWSLSLAGSNAVTDAFLQCIEGLTR